MYESFFGLGKRPFAATPDPECFVPVAGAFQSYADLLQCATDGRGIGVLTAPAGLGKTLVCQCVARELSRQFAVVFLPTGNFSTRRSLLQAILFELGHSYVRMGDQELRLALASTLKRIRPAQRGVVLIADEAHLLAPRLLEELRGMTNLIDAGEPLVRLVTAGHLTLEETLSQPSLSGFNQRIGSHVTLQPFSRAESAEYVARRLAWAGANVPDVFHPDALAAVCEASDGSPRCINQLCDHSLLLGYLATEKPLTVTTVREALDDLKQLPLSWNEPSSGRSAVTWAELQVERAMLAAESGDPALGRPRPQSVRSDGRRSNPALEDADESASIEIAGDNREADGGDATAAVEFGAASEAFTPAIDAPDVEVSEGAIEIGGSVEIGAPIATVPAIPHKRNPGTDVQSTDHAFTTTRDEEVVIDRYAALDAVSRRTATILVACQSSGQPSGRRPLAGLSKTTGDLHPPHGKENGLAVSAAVSSAKVASEVVGVRCNRNAASSNAVDREIGTPVQIDVHAASQLEFQVSTTGESPLTSRHEQTECVGCDESAVADSRANNVDGDPPKFDIVLPEDDSIEVRRNALGGSPCREMGDPVESASGRRPYELRFSELMRRRKGA